MTNDNPPSTMPDEPPPRRVRASALALGMVIGAAAAVAIGTALLMYTSKGAPPLLTAESYQQALDRWQQHGPANYDLEVDVAGRQSGTIRLEVRGGEPTALTRDGLVPARRTWVYWTIPEQFESIQREMTADPQTTFGVPDRAQIILRAEFDPDLGYPRRYQREILGRDESIRWEIVRFQPVP